MFEARSWCRRHRRTNWFIHLPSYEVQLLELTELLDVTLLLEVEWLDHEELDTDDQELELTLLLDDVTDIELSLELDGLDADDEDEVWCELHEELDTEELDRLLLDTLELDAELVDVLIDEDDRLDHDELDTLDEVTLIDEELVLRCELHEELDRLDWLLDWLLLDTDDWLEVEVGDELELSLDTEDQELELTLDDELDSELDSELDELDDRSSIDRICSRFTWSEAGPGN